MSGASVYTFPTLFCFLGFILLIVALVVSPATLIAERSVWRELPNCTVVEVRHGLVHSELSYRNTCVVALSSSVCAPLCVALVKCERSVVVQQSNRTNATNSTSSQTMLLLAWSMNALFAQTRSPQPWCNANTTLEPLNVLQNPLAALNQSADLKMRYDCLYGDVACCPSCSELKLNELAGELRLKSFVDLGAVGISLMCVGCLMFTLLLCILHQPWKVCRRCCRQANASDRQLDVVRNDDFNDVDNQALQEMLGRSRAGVVSHNPRHGSRGRHRRRRKRDLVDPSAPPLDDSDDNDDVDTSPTVPAVAVVCADCGMPFVANSDALVCTSCGKVSQVRLEQIAFPFCAGDSVMCTVCLDDIAEGARIVTLPCTHLYHVECIAEWLRKKSICPQCLTVCT
jgi:hypothetical protein